MTELLGKAPLRLDVCYVVIENEQMDGLKLSAVNTETSKEFKLLSELLTPSLVAC